MRYNIPAGTPIIIYGLQHIDYSTNVVATTDRDCVIQDFDRTCIIDSWKDALFGFLNREDVYLRFPSDMTSEGKMFWLIVSYKNVVVTK